MMELNRAEDQAAYDQLKRHVETLDQTQNSLTELKRSLERSRTNIGTGKDKQTPAFFTLIEIHIETISGIIGQGQNQLKSAHICIGAIKGFDVKYAKLVKENQKQNEKIAVFEQDREDREAVKSWFSGKSGIITKAATTIGGIGIIAAAVMNYFSKGGP